MRLKIVSIEDRNFRGFKAVVLSIMNSGEILPSAFLIEISQKEMFGTKVAGFQMCGLDALILDKVKESGRFNQEALKNIELINTKMQLVEN